MASEIGIGSVSLWCEYVIRILLRAFIVVCSDKRLSSFWHDLRNEGGVLVTSKRKCARVGYTVHVMKELMNRGLKLV